MDDGVTFAADSSGTRWTSTAGQIMRTVGRTLVGACIVILGSTVLAAVVALVVDPSTAALLAERVIPAAGIALGIGQALSLVGRDLEREANMLNGLTIRIDDHGVSWTGPVAGDRDWGDLAHVAVTANRPGRRRLRLVASASTSDPGLLESTAVRLVRRILWPDRFLLDVPVDRLALPAHRVFDAIRQRSAGRFPDVYSPAQFTTPQGEHR